ncbi:BlaI/MecI/CopY family transcriptional regulator [Staphylococcus simulans]|uniref:BlaI/MecI/CopY family transcriptional regulator n=1 Tax=Staphylococcus simulans TaxID=1286 RepID=UPI0021CF0F9F|nr:BlaI/MecI/CopY family transcriptional regulator [Staphylococcus simulans]
MKNNEKEISSSEWEVMNVIWQYKNISANDVINNLNGYNKWDPKTIRTLINRLFNKGYIDRKKENKVYIYFPVVKEDDVKYETSKNFINKVFKGGLKSLVLNFVEKKDLTQKEIDELREILDDNTDER